LSFYVDVSFYVALSLYVSLSLSLSLPVTFPLSPGSAVAPRVRPAELAPTLAGTFRRRFFAT
jgi:hypothetical protein